MRVRAGPGLLVLLVCIVCLLDGCAPTTGVPPAAHGCGALGPTVRPTVGDPATRNLISRDLDAFATRAWNGAAPAVRPSRQPGGLYINYRPEFDGVSHAASETNINTDGQSDAEAHAGSRHDPLADLAILRDLDAASAAGIGTAATDRLRCRLQPVVTAEFSQYGPPRGSVYRDLTNLSELDPRGPWRAAAHGFAVHLATTFSDPATLGSTAAQPQVRPDWVAASAAALVDAGGRFDTPAWTALGAELAVQLATRAANPVTGLFPNGLDVDAAGVVTVTDPLTRVGAQAQLLDDLLTVADRTGNRQLRTAVSAGLGAVMSPDIGLADGGHGGWFFAVDADGSDLRTAYKETRSAWMVPLLQHAERSGLPVATGAADEAERIVRASMYLASSGGYVYRLTPDWTVYRDSRTAPLGENWVSSEATAIAVHVLLGDLR
jgi:hypothetical protein